MVRLDDRAPRRPRSATRAADPPVVQPGWPTTIPARPFGQALITSACRGWVQIIGSRLSALATEAGRFVWVVELGGFSTLADGERAPVLCQRDPGAVLERA